MIFFTTFAPSNNNPLVRLARKRWEGRTRSVPRHNVHNRQPRHQEHRLPLCQDGYNDVHLVIHHPSHSEFPRSLRLWNLRKRTVVYTPNIKKTII